MQLSRRTLTRNEVRAKLMAPSVRKCAGCWQITPVSELWDNRCPSCNEERLTSGR